MKSTVQNLRNLINETLDYQTFINFNLNNIRPEQLAPTAPLQNDLYPSLNLNNIQPVQYFHTAPSQDDDLGVTILR